MISTANDLKLRKGCTFVFVEPSSIGLPPASKSINLANVEWINFDIENKDTYAACIHFASGRTKKFKGDDAIRLRECVEKIET